MELITFKNYIGYKMSRFVIRTKGKAGKALFLRAVFSAQPKRLDRIGWNSDMLKQNQFWTTFRGCALRGGSARRWTRRFGLHEGVPERIFVNWPLRPRVPSAAYNGSKYGQVRTKRASARSVQSCNFGYCGRLLLSGAPMGVFDRGEILCACRDDSKNYLWV